MLCVLHCHQVCCATVLGCQKKKKKADKNTPKISAQSMRMKNASKRGTMCLCGYIAHFLFPISVCASKNSTVAVSQDYSVLTSSV